MRENNTHDFLKERVLDAIQHQQLLQIQGGGSKAFYGREPTGEPISTLDHSGLVNYQPQELVITAKSGTLLSEVEALLEEKGQMLPFEPPHFSDKTTLGGAIASGLSGPRRAYSGAARDFVLGVRIINGKGEILRFGGEVMKNVAGYDISRLMTGSMGMLGILLDISLKVLPRPHNEVTLRVERKPTEAIDLLNQISMSDAPVSASLYDGEYIYLRLQGEVTSLKVGGQTIDGEPVEENHFWQNLRDHKLDFFQNKKPLWRLSLPSDAAYLSQYKDQLIEWGGALRWVYSDESPEQIRKTVSAEGGTATLFRGEDVEADIFHPLSSGVEQIHRNLKQAFDPHGIFNSGQMYRGI